jgi:hypothetical protein
MLTTKLALRLARKWQTVWEASRKPQPVLNSAWERLESRFVIAQQVRQRLEFVSDRHFTVGVRNLTADLGYHLGEMARMVSSLREELSARRPPKPDLASWLADIRQLEDEFGDVEVKWKKTVVRVVTEPITLRGVELGTFAIDFHWDRLGSAKGDNCFDIVALEPNPAQGRDDILHPHVQGHDICAGDAKKPVENAIEQGRFTEAFLLLRSVLTTYNPSSPYVTLEKWTGQPCHDCGDRVDDEYRYCCDGCYSDFCDHCIGSCAVCMTSRCSGCLDACAVCDSQCCSSCLETVEDDDRVCRRCFANCADCRRRLPKNELIDDLCPACQPEEGEFEDDHELIALTQMPIESPDYETPDVFPNGLVETPVPMPCRSD